MISQWLEVEHMVWLKTGLIYKVEAAVGIKDDQPLYQAKVYMTGVKESPFTFEFTSREKANDFTERLLYGKPANT
jgi:hypothetical protein